VPVVVVHAANATNATQQAMAMAVRNPNLYDR
jgi:hypothetical protein